MLEDLKPVLVTDLFPEILEALVKLLEGLSPEEWNKPTACTGWNVHDVATHLLGGEIGNLSRRRDGFSLPVKITSWEELVQFINDWNGAWVQAGRRISPELLIDLLVHTGAQMNATFHSLDPYALGSPVSWAGPEPAPIWLDLAREYTERWHHQQHIRDAVGKPGLKEPRYLAPVLGAFVRALPHTYRSIAAPNGTSVSLIITGEAGSRWTILRENQNWQLYQGVPDEMSAEMIIDQEVAWRLFTRGLDQEQALDHITLQGDQSLGEKILDMVSIIA